MLDLSNLANAVKHEGGITRRLFLAYGSALASLPLLAARSHAAQEKVSFSTNPFSMGITSGDPDSQSVVLWTRLAPQPLEPNGGMSNTTIPVQWEVSETESFSKVVAKGTASATPELGHSVHAIAEGLQPDHWYFYRFRAGDAETAIGRTRTLPLATATPGQLKIAHASCQNYEHGLYTAYEQMAKDDLDFVFFLGDYIYEKAGKDAQVRKHFGNNCESLGEYRTRYGQYRSDPLLQAMHRNCPWFVTWDDHEVQNDYADNNSEFDDVDPVKFLKQRAQAYQCYYEMMPLRPTSVPRGPDMQLYRKASFGQLAEFQILDTRQYRSNQPNAGKKSELNSAAMSSSTTMMGPRQFAWLKDNLVKSNATWNVLAQQVLMGLVTATFDGPNYTFAMDKWPGYVYERMQLGKFLGDQNVRNPVVLTGDIHSNWANELRINDRVQDTPVVAVELVGTSISSTGNGPAVPDYMDKMKSANPFVKFHSKERGYVRSTITPKTWKADFVAVEDVTKPGANVLNRASVVIESGRSGIHPA